MIALYKDPKGEKVFDKYETPSFKSQLQHTQKQQPTDSATETVDSLKKRIEELENMVIENPIHVHLLWVLILLYLHACMLLLYKGRPKLSVLNACIFYTIMTLCTFH